MPDCAGEPAQPALDRLQGGGQQGVARPGLASWTHHSFLGLNALGWASFLTLWVLQALIISRGMESVRRFQDF